VIDTQGGVINGAAVELRGTGSETTHTGPDGTFSFDGVPVGTVSVQVEAPGFAGRSQDELTRLNEFLKRAKEVQAKQDDPNAAKPQPGATDKTPPAAETPKTPEAPKPPKPDAPKA
jgi:hypothetical protein